MPLFRQRLPSLHPNMTLEDIAKARERMERLPCSPQRSALAVRMNTMEQAKRDAETLPQLMSSDYRLLPDYERVTEWRRRIAALEAIQERLYVLGALGKKERNAIRWQLGWLQLAIKWEPERSIPEGVPIPDGVLVVVRALASVHAVAAEPTLEA